MIKAAVLGSPIDHSLSPALHKRAYELLGVPGSYGAIDLLPEAAESFFLSALDEGWTGFSLTMPLKEAIFSMRDRIQFSIDPIAERMRSANTLLVTEGGYTATSTDRTGFIRLFEGVKKDRVAIIGGGGTARAALAALDGSAAQIDLLLRSTHRIDSLAKIALNSSVDFYGMDHSLRGYDLVIATVPSGATDAIAADLDFAIPTLCEVLYNPYPTALLAKARSLGGQTLDGIDLLVEQAMDQVALFAGMAFDLHSMHQALQAVGRAHLR
jgi:shikimate dehydrogenase